MDDRPRSRLGTLPATTRTVDLTQRQPVERDTAFQDWSVDGVPLRTHVAARWGVAEPPRELTRLWPDAPEQALHGLRALLGEAPPDMSDGRTALLLCPVDQDVDCRALTTRVVRRADVVEWRDVGWQVDFEDFLPQADEYGPLLSFRFGASQYETLLRSLLTEYEALAEHLPERPSIEPHRRRFWRRRVD